MFLIKGTVKKKCGNIGGLVGSGVGQNPQKNMPLKSILDHFKSF